VTTDDAKRYTMSVDDVRKRLGVSRQTVHDLARKSKVLSFITRKRGTKNWLFFDPIEVERHAQERGVVSEEV